MKRTSLALTSRCLAVLAPLMISACGSDGYHGTPPVISPMFYAYISSAGTSANASGAVYEYAINDDYSASPLSQPSIAAGAYPAAVIVNQGNVYTVNVGDGTISQFTIAFDNTLAAMNPAIVTNPGMHTLGAAPASAVIDFSGSYLYVVNTADNTLSQFGIAGNGQLSPLTPSTVAAGVAPVAIVSVQVPDTPMQYYYVLNSGAPGSAGSISIYAASGQNGALTLIDSIAAGTNPSAIVVDNIDSTVNVIDTCDTAQCSGAIKTFTIGANAALTDTGTTVAAGSDAVNMVVNDNGVDPYAYVISNGAGAGANGGTLWQYGVQSSGELTSLTPPTVVLGSTAVAQYLDVNLLVVLTANTGTGGTLNYYALGTGGTATLNGTTPITAPYPTAMDVHRLLDP